MNTNDRLHEIFYRFPKEFPLPFLLDGATGTALMKLGMPAGACTETYVTEHPDAIYQIQSRYGKSGSDAVLAPTFGANRAVMRRHGLAETEVQALNTTLVAIAKKSRCSCTACGNHNDSHLRIGADLSPTGLFIEPYGDTPFEAIVEIYREQVQALLAAGVDFFITETNISLAEARAAVIAVRELNADIPVFVTLTVDEHGRTMSGDTLLSAVLVLGELGVNAFGTNCSTGPEEMLRALAPVVPYAVAMGIPVIAKPNAGTPRENGDGTQSFSLSAADMERYIPVFFANGIFVLGGCCGTDDAYIALLRRYADAFVLPDPPAFLTDPLPKPEHLACTNREVINIADMDLDAAVFIPANDDLPDALMDCEDDVVCIDLGAVGADAFLECMAFLFVPVVIRGEKTQVERVRRLYNGRLKVVGSW